MIPPMRRSIIPSRRSRCVKAQAVGTGEVLTHTPGQAQAAA